MTIEAWFCERFRKSGKFRRTAVSGIKGLDQSWQREAEVRASTSTVSRTDVVRLCESELMTTGSADLPVNRFLAPFTRYSPSGLDEEPTASMHRPRTAARVEAADKAMPGDLLEGVARENFCCCKA